MDTGSSCQWRQQGLDDSRRSPSIRVARPPWKAVGRAESCISGRRNLLGEQESLPLRAKGAGESGGHEVGSKDSRFVLGEGPNSSGLPWVGGRIESDGQGS